MFILSTRSPAGRRALVHTHPRAHPAVRLSVAGSAQVMVRAGGASPPRVRVRAEGGLRVWSAHVHNPPPWRPPFPSAAPQPSRHSPDSSGGSRAGRATASVLPRRPDRRVPGSRGNRVHVPPPWAQAAKSARGRRVAPLRQGGGAAACGGAGLLPIGRGGKGPRETRLPNPLNGSFGWASWSSPRNSLTGGRERSCLSRCGVRSPELQAGEPCLPYDPGQVPVFPYRKQANFSETKSQTRMLVTHQTGDRNSRSRPQSLCRPGKAGEEGSGGRCKDSAPTTCFSLPELWVLQEKLEIWILLYFLGEISECTIVGS